MSNIWEYISSSTTPASHFMESIVRSESDKMNLIQGKKSTLCKAKKLASLTMNPVPDAKISWDRTPNENRNKQLWDRLNQDIKILPQRDDAVAARLEPVITLKKF